MMLWMNWNLGLTAVWSTVSSESRGDAEDRKVDMENVEEGLMVDTF
jgi:hypothetical protein